jgi:hypothetical protein
MLLGVLPDGYTDLNLLYLDLLPATLLDSVPA